MIFSFFFQIYEYIINYHLVNEESEVADFKSSLTTLSFEPIFTFKQQKNKKPVKKINSLKIKEYLIR